MIYSSAIGFYRRHVSPRKGFKCASARYHGGPSCSMVIESILNAHGLWRGLPLIRAQFARCRTASLALSQSHEEEEPRGATPTSSSSEHPSRDSRRRQRPKGRGACHPADCGSAVLEGGVNPSCDDVACGCEAGELACNSLSGIGEVFSGCEIGSCEFGACDFS